MTTNDKPTKTYIIETSKKTITWQTPADNSSVLLAREIRKLEDEGHSIQRVTGK